VIHFHKVVKCFDDLRAVDGVDLHVRRGEVFGLLGPNGAGKTTSIRLLVGLLRPESGSIEVGGHSMARAAREAKQLMGYVPDRPYVYEKLSGLEYMEFMGGLWGLPRDLALKRGLAVLERFRMADAAPRLVEGYSHGMRQKLALAGAFLHQPELLVIDEPMVGLDPRAAREIKVMFREVAEGGGTVLLTTHQLDVAEATCDRIGIIGEGRLIAMGSMEDLRQQSSSPGSNLEGLFLRLTEEEEEEIAEREAVRLQGAEAEVSP
jgi:ABC-2 type transport system ATP-binding protein